MRRRTARCGMIASFLVAAPVAGQVSQMHNATPAAVTEALGATLIPQGFKAGKANEKGALFSLDKGNIPQNTPQGTVFYETVIEIQSHYKQKGDALEVSLKEEVVRTYRSDEQRVQVNTRAELDNLQKLLDGIRADIEAKGKAADSTAKHDSTSH